MWRSSKILVLMCAARAEVEARPAFPIGRTAIDMLRKLNHEIVLGFLLASLFWIGVLGRQAWHSTDSKHAEECIEIAKKAGFKTDECKTFLERSASDPVAAFTLVLSLSTIALWLVTRRSADIAERAFSDLERPYVYIFGAKGLARYSETMDPYDFLKYSVANYGKTPASIVSAALVINVGTGPETPIDVGPWHKLIEPPIMMPNERRDDEKTVPDSISTSEYADEYTSPSDAFTVPDLKDGTNFFFWARIKYHGPFSNGHETSACWQWDQKSSRLILYGDEKYNYTR
jgi:hypothetical protein